MIMREKGEKKRERERERKRKGMLYTTRKSRRKRERKKEKKSQSGVLRLRSGMDLDELGEPEGTDSMDMNKYIRQIEIEICWN